MASVHWLINETVICFKNFGIALSLSYHCDENPFTTPNKVGAAIGPNDWWSAATCNESFDSHYTRTRLHGLDILNMYSSCGHTCNNEALSHLRTTPDWHVKRSKIINFTICERRMAVIKTFKWKLCHHTCDSFDFALSTCKAVDFNGP